MIEEEFGFAKSALKQAIGLLPDNALVGIVSFGTQAHAHEIGFSDLAKAYVFRGDKEVSKEQVLEQLGLGASGRRGTIGGFPMGKDGLNNSALDRFLLPASECEYTLDSVSFPLFLLLMMSLSKVFGWTLMNVLKLSFMFWVRCSCWRSCKRISGQLSLVVVLCGAPEWL